MQKTLADLMNAHQADAQAAQEPLHDACIIHLHFERPTHFEHSTHVFCDFRYCFACRACLCYFVMLVQGDGETRCAQNCSNTPHGG